MKRISLLIMVMILVCSLAYGLAYAKDEAAPVPAQKEGILGIDLSISYMHTIYQDKMFRDDGKGFKVELSHKEILPFLKIWGSGEEGGLRLTGQTAGKFRLWGLGLGAKVQPIKEVPLIIFLDGGYFIPDSDLNGMDKCSEGQGYYWTELLQGIGLNRPPWSEFNQHYKYKISSNFGGTVGFEIKQNLYKNLSLNLMGAYRYLNLPESWDAYNAQGANIQTKEKRDLSAFQFGIGLKYVF